VNLVANDAARKVYGSVVSGNYFDAFGVKPEIGRMLLPEEDRFPGMHAVVVISYVLWQCVFDNDSSVVDKDNDSSTTYNAQRVAGQSQDRICLWEYQKQ
jgi:hypothetical protein